MNDENLFSRRQPTDPSAKRFIMSMGCGEPFVRDGIEFFVIKVKGKFPFSGTWCNDILTLAS